MKTQKTSVLTRAFQSNNWHYNPKHEQMLSNQKSTNNNSSHNWRQSLLELSVKTKREMYAPAGNLSHNVKPLWIRNDVHNPVCTSLEMQQHITSMCPATIVTVDFFLFLATFFYSQWDKNQHHVNDNSYSIYTRTHKCQHVLEGNCYSKTAGIGKTECRKKWRI